MLSTSEGGLS